MLHNYTILIISIYMHGKNDFKLKYPEIQIDTDLKIILLNIKIIT